eukprot:5216252-Ditylum_brightwellii.AAC.2
MEHPEAFEVAKREIIHIMGQEEEERAQRDMKEDFANKLAKKTQEVIELQNRQETQKSLDQKHAALVLSLACRRWQARKAVRIKCMEMFEKRFHEDYHAFYYRNRTT